MARLHPSILLGFSMIVIAAVAAQEARYEGKVTTIDGNRVELQVQVDKKDKRLWFVVTPETPIRESDNTSTVAATAIRKNAQLAMVIAPGDDVAGTEWSCPMHTHVAEQAPGKCPVCGMSLKQRERGRRVRDIHVLSAKLRQ